MVTNVHVQNPVILIRIHAIRNFAWGERFPFTDFAKVQVLKKNKKSPQKYMQQKTTTYTKFTCSKDKQNICII